MQRVLDSFALTQALTRIIRRGIWFALLLIIATFARGQSLSLPTSGQFHIGEAMPVTLTAEKPGLIQIRGEGIQGIDWPAAGRGSVTVPLTIWRGDGDLTLTVNGTPQLVKLVALDPSDDPAARVIAGLADDDSLLAWSPGRPLAQRRWVMLAVLAGTLAVGAVATWRGRRGAIASLVMAGAVCGGIAVFAPSPPARREIAVRDHPDFKEIHLAATRSATLREPFGDGLWLIPSTTSKIDSLQPTLECSTAGRPVAIQIHLSEQERARFIRRTKSVN